MDKSIEEECWRKVQVDGDGRRHVLVYCLVPLVLSVGRELNGNKQGRTVTWILCRGVWCAEFLANLKCIYEFGNCVTVQCILPVLSALLE